jgi:chromosome segregation ATPase
MVALRGGRTEMWAVSIGLAIWILYVASPAAALPYELESKFEELEAKIMELDGKIKDLESENSSRQDEISDLESKNDDLEKKLADEEDAFDDFKRCILKTSWFKRDTCYR